MRYERNQIIRKLFNYIGENAWIESTFNCDYGYNITIGDNFYANTNCTILDCAKVTIGNNVLIGPNVSLYTPNHAIYADERKEGFSTSRRGFEPPTYSFRKSIKMGILWTIFFQNAYLPTFLVNQNQTIIIKEI